VNARVIAACCCCDHLLNRELLRVRATAELEQFSIGLDPK